MNDYKMNHAKKHKDTQVDYITVIDHSTLKKEIKTLLEIKVDGKQKLKELLKLYDNNFNKLNIHIDELIDIAIEKNKKYESEITILQDKNKALEDKVNALEELFKEKTKIMKQEVLL